MGSVLQAKPATGNTTPHRSWQSAVGSGLLLRMEEANTCYGNEVPGLMRQHSY
jgi:hypothetical protein